MTKIVLEMVALIFQRIERFIFDAPPRSGTLHEPINRALVDAQVGHPTEMLDFALYRFPTLNEVDPQRSIRCVERHPTDQAKPMVNPLFGV